MTLSAPVYKDIRLPNRPDPANALKLDMLAVPMLRRMMNVGMPINVDKLQDLRKLLEAELATLHGQITEYIPPALLQSTTGKMFNLDSPEQRAVFLFEHLKVGNGQRLKMTPTGKRPTMGKKQLEILKSQHPVVQLMLDYSERVKLKDTYTDGLVTKARLHKGGGPGKGGKGGKGGCWCGWWHWTDHRRIHTQILSTRTLTARFSCVAGSTNLITSRGTFRIDQYIPIVGDTIQTHTGQWKPILRKVYKGLDSMFRVHLSNGSVLECTHEHRLSSKGQWLALSDLSIGDELDSYECIQTIPNQKQHQGSIGDVLRRREADAVGFIEGFQDTVLDNAVHRPSIPTTRTVQIGEAVAILQKQDGDSKPHVGQEWRPTPQLDRGCFGQPWEANQKDWEKALLCTSDSICRSVGNTCAETTSAIADPPYRREPTEQLAGQLGVGHKQGPWETTFHGSEIQAITAMGEMGVWDIEVEEDHSYLAQGFINHNSKTPNLQQIPVRSEWGRRIRACFEAEEGRVLVDSDFSQIELRALAHCAQEPTMIEVFKQPDADIHTATAVKAFGVPVPKDKKSKEYEQWALDYRLPSKNIGFMIIFGAAAMGLQAQLALSGVYWELLQCAQFIADWLAAFEGVASYMDEQRYRARRYGLVWEPFGGTRLIPEVKSSIPRQVAQGDRYAGNFKITSLSAGLMKLAMAVNWDHYKSVYNSTGAKQFAQPLMTIHDELIWECDEGKSEGLLDGCVEDMNSTGDGWFRVPVMSSGKVSQCWEK